jgi:putative FmdB family regulatory protein
MPLYDFQCVGCGREFEALVRPQDPAPTCPSCQRQDLKRLPASFALSTDESRAASALKSRKSQIAKRKDAIIADEEYRAHHDH